MKSRLNLCLLVAVVFILAAGCAPTQMQLQLWEASEKGDTAAVQVLLEHGADVNVKTKGSFTALMGAEMMGRVEVIRMLKQAGAK